MQTVHFDRLQTVRLDGESQNGCAEICQEPNGTHWVKLCIKSDICQREVLNALDECIPVRLNNGALELLLPWYEGIPLRQWLYERTPTLGQRRDICLSLLEQQVELQRKLPPCFTALSANTENLTIKNTSAHLQYLPELRKWEPDIGEPQAVCALAAVISEVLTPKLGKWPLRQLPEELQLLHRRQKERNYTSWGQLQRDVAAIPDDLPRRRPILYSYILRAQDLLSRYGKYILRILAFVLFTAALLSLLLVYLQRKNQSGPAWQGMPQVGDQDLRNGEGGE
ncbi:MAG: hypothetical protein K2N78_10890 [Oscillospiraceae bacterium]|nr:hypothetical protein [Oscillospiraceae bacterium]